MIDASSRRTLQLFPSILTADFGRIDDEIQAVLPYVDGFHLDVMDGHYVENLTFGPAMVEAIRRSCDIPLHVHLMIANPGLYAQRFVEAGADTILFHPEVVNDVSETIETIVHGGAGAGIAIVPEGSLEALESNLGQIEVVLIMTVRPGFGGQGFLYEALPNVDRVRLMIQEQGSSVDIEVDGGVKLSTLDDAVSAGGNIMVSGSGIYDGVDARTAARKLRQRLSELEGPTA